MRPTSRPIDSITEEERPLVGERKHANPGARGMCNALRLCNANDATRR